MTKSVLITGSSRGIGYASAKLFASKGWEVIITGREQETLDTALKTIKAETSNDKLRAHVVDMELPESISKLFSSIYQLDALINNAAILNMGNVFELSDDDFNQMMQVNVTGVMQASKHAFNLMKKSGGSIVNISSIAGIQNTSKFTGLWGYSASKAAVIGLTEGMAAEGEPYNIRVNCIAPAATATVMLEKAAPGFKPKAVPEDIANIIYYLADSEQSGIINGTTIPVISHE